jgi:hypothetical protein
LLGRQTKDINWSLGEKKNARALEKSLQSTRFEFDEVRTYMNNTLPCVNVTELVETYSQPDRSGKHALDSLKCQLRVTQPCGPEDLE